MAVVTSATELKSRLDRILDELLAHNGFGSILVEFRLLKRQQKEVILHYGRQYRFVVDFVPDKPDDARS